MKQSRFWVVFGALVLALALLGGACGGGEEAAPPPPPAEPAAEEPAPPAEEPAPAAEEPAPAEAPTGEPLIIGAAVDLTTAMAAFDGPAIAAAQAKAEEINAAGGIDGRPVEIRVIDHQLDPEQTKQAALDLIDQGAEVMLVTCDVDWATPAIQPAIEAGLLTISPCISTDQMGPKRFGELGKLAFTMGSIAQDEGAAVAEWAIDQGWTRVVTVRDNAIVYFQNVVQAFEKRFTELGGEIVASEGFTQGDGTVANAVTAVDAASGDVDGIAMCTFGEDLTAFLDGLRSLGNETPITGCWALDGAIFWPEGLTNYTFTGYSSLYGDDPNPDIKALGEALTAAETPPITGGFYLGAVAMEVIKQAIEEAGSTEGDALATLLESGKEFQVTGGSISFTPELHGVTGREWRFIQAGGGKGTYVESRTASSPADIG
jgi:branched-chain amino acid transport system substrate-binding protein